MTSLARPRSRWKDIEQVGPDAPSPVSEASFRSQNFRVAASQFEKRKSEIGNRLVLIDVFANKKYEIDNY